MVVGATDFVLPAGVAVRHLRHDPVEAGHSPVVVLPPVRTFRRTSTLRIVSQFRKLPSHSVGLSLAPSSPSRFSGRSARSGCSSRCTSNRSRSSRNIYSGVGPRVRETRAGG